MQRTHFTAGYTLYIPLPSVSLPLYGLVPCVSLPFLFPIVTKHLFVTAEGAALAWIHTHTHTHTRIHSIPPPVISALGEVSARAEPIAHGHFSTSQFPPSHTHSPHTHYPCLVFCPFVYVRVFVCLSGSSQSFGGWTLRRPNRADRGACF